MIDLRSTAKEFRLTDGSGYRFDITCTLNPDIGWSASVTVHSSRMKDDESALIALRPALERLLSMLPVGEP